MSRYSAIKAATNAYIKTNGRQEITGAILNAVMIATIDSLGKFYQFGGVAIPTTDPGNLDQNVAFIAGTEGTYTEMGSIELTAGEVAILKFDGEWAKQTIYSVPRNVSDLVNDLGYVTRAVSDLVNYYTKGETEQLINTITNQTFVVAWDGASVPVPADIPDGVVVNYGGNDYTGTLEASEDTLGKVYLVSNGSGSDMYVTSGGGGYTWVFAGTTSIDMSGYVTQDEFDALDLIVEGGDVEVLTPQSLTADKYYNTNGSTIPESPSNKTDCYCAKIAVTPGEIYRVRGLRNSGTGTRVYATADSDRGRLRYALTGSARQTYDLTIEAGEAWLYVNLVDYDSAQDGCWKVTTEHRDGLVDRVAALEAENIPNVVDSLDSTSTTDALSANQGRVLNEDINGVTTPTYTDQEVIDSKYFNTQNSRVPSKSNLASATGTSCVYLNVTPGEVYRIYGKGDSGSHQLYALADSDRYVVQDGVPGVAMNTRTTPLDLTIPDGVAILVVNLYQYSSATDKVQKVGSTTSECVKTRLSALETALPEVEADALPLKGKMVMAFGDSIWDYTYNQKGVTSYLAEISGASVFKAAIGGTRFVQRTTPVDNPTSSTEAYAALDICNMVKAWCEADYTKQDAATTYLNDHTARVNALKNNPIGSVDIVVIGGGTNDMTANSPIGTDTDNGFTTLWGSFNKMVELLLTANPKLKIYFVSPVVGYHGAGGRTDANWDDNHQFSSGLTKPQYIERFTAMARKSHIPYIDVYSTLGWNQTNFSAYFLDTDDHHPYKGFDVIARRLYGQMKALME